MRSSPKSEPSPAEKPNCERLRCRCGAGPGDPKNLVYFLQENREAPGHFIFYEIFANKEDFEAHNVMPYVLAWFQRLPELADGGVKVMRMEVLGHRTTISR